MNMINRMNVKLIIFAKFREVFGTLANVFALAGVLYGFDVAGKAFLLKIAQFSSF